MAAPQFISRNEFQEGLNYLYGRLTRYQDIRIEAIAIRIDSTNTRLDRAEATQAQIQKDQAQIQKDQAQIRKDQAQIQKDQAQIQKNVADIITFQKTLMDAFNATVAGLSKQIADSHVALMEEINQLKRPPS